MPVSEQPGEHRAQRERALGQREVQIDPFLPRFIDGRLIMYRFFASITVLSFVVLTTSSASAAKPQAYPACYTEQGCMTACVQAGGHNCGIWCKRREGQLPPCK